MTYDEAVRWLAAQGGRQDRWGWIADDYSGCTVIIDRLGGINRTGNAKDMSDASYRKAFVEAVELLREAVA